MPEKRGPTESRANLNLREARSPADGEAQSFRPRRACSTRSTPPATRPVAPRAPRRPLPFAAPPPPTGSPSWEQTFSLALRKLPTSHTRSNKPKGSRRRVRSPTSISLVEAAFKPARAALRPSQTLVSDTSVGRLDATFIAHFFGAQRRGGAAARTEPFRAKGLRPPPHSHACVRCLSPCPRGAARCCGPRRQTTQHAEKALLLNSVSGTGARRKPQLISSAPRSPTQRAIAASQLTLGCATYAAQISRAIHAMRCRAKSRLNKPAAKP